MNAPYGFRKSRLHWFACPRCAYCSAYSYSAGTIDPERRKMKLVFWCPSCGRLCALKDPWRMPALTLLIVLASFAFIYWLLTGGLMQSNFGLALFGFLCATLGVHGLLFYIGRFVNRYVAIERSEP